jgi:hypothetical protein
MFSLFVTLNRMQRKQATANFDDLRGLSASPVGTSVPTRIQPPLSRRIFSESVRSKSKFAMDVWPTGINDLELCNACWLIGLHTKCSSYSSGASWSHNDEVIPYTN